MIHNLPDHFIQTVTNTFEEDGIEWLQQLPELLAQVTEQHNLTIGKPFDLSYNYVTSATDVDGNPLVIKLGVPRQELIDEMNALRIYNGRAANKIYHGDPEMGLLLIEQVFPGQTMIKHGLANDNQATRDVAELMRSLWRPLPEQHGFRSIKDWGKGFDRLREHFNRRTGPFPEELIIQAEALYQRPIENPVLLHGDLHHGNALSGTKRPWVAIDPKGIVGPPIYECGAWLRNPAPDELTAPDAKERFGRRCAIFAEHLNTSIDEIKAWGIAQALLSAWWSLEDNDPNWHIMLDFVEKIRE